MSFTKDGFYKQLGTYIGDNEFVLLAGGDHIKFGNGMDQIPLSNNQISTGLNADMVDNFHANELLTYFSGGQLSSNGNILSQSSTYLTVGGTTYFTYENAANIINSLSISKLSSDNDTNLTVGMTINGIPSADATVTDLYARYTYQLLNSQTITIGETSRSFDGTADISWTLANIFGANAIGGTNNPIYYNGNAFIAISDTVGSTTKPIWLNAGVLTAGSYELKATVNDGTVNRIAWYSGTNAISSGSITTDGGYLGMVNYLSVNTAHQTSYRVYVDGSVYSTSGYWKYGSDNNYALTGAGGHFAIHTGRNNEANKLVRTDGSGYIQAGWINTTSGDMGTTAMDRVYCSNDSYIRYKTKANFVNGLDAYWANVKVSATSNTGTQPTFNTCYTSNWFRSTGATGWYNESYGGGWYMTDSSWVRTYNSKGVVATCYYASNWASATYLLRSDGGAAAFNWSGQSGQPTWIWGGNSQHNYYVYNPSNFSVNYANSSGTASTLLTSNSSQGGNACYNANPGLHFYRYSGDNNTIGGGDGWIIQWSWNPGSVGGQLYLDDNPSGIIGIRGCTGSSGTTPTGFTSWWRLYSDNYHPQAGNADTVDGYHASSFALASHSHSYLPLSGGTMTGSIAFNGGSFEQVGRRWFYGTTRNCGWKYDYSGNEALIISSGTYGNARISFYTCGRLSLNDSNGQWNSKDADFYIYNGNGYFLTAAFATSDARKKYDIRDVLNRDVVDLFNTDNGYIRHFKWKENNKNSYGVIAQEIMEFCPEAVDDVGDHLSVNYNAIYGKIIGAMFKKIKELDRKVKEQDIIIKKLKGDS